MKIKLASPEAYRSTQENYPSSNFLQSAEISQLQEARQNFVKVERLLFIENEQVVGQALVNYRRKMKFFTEALVVQGPLLDFDNQQQVAKAVQLLSQHVKKQRAISLMLHPFIVHQIKSESLETLEDNLQAATLQTLTKLGFSHHQDLEDNNSGVSQAFVKPLTAFEDMQAILDTFSPSMKRDIKKFNALQVKVEELPLDRLDEFYKILTETSQRKGFHVQDLEFFQLIKTQLQQRAKFMLAYLDCPAYQAYLDENIQAFQAKIEQLSSGTISKRTKGAIADATDQLNSYLKRQKQLDEMQITTPRLPLSAYLFIDFGHEMVSYAGGNYEEYMNFGGATLINIEMIRQAKAKNLPYFSFGGTIETDSANQGQGNFNYKRQFGGQLNVYLGSFTKPIGLLGKLLHR